MLELFFHRIARRQAWARRAEAGSVGWICGLIVGGGSYAFTGSAWSWWIAPLAALAGALAAHGPTRVEAADLADRHFRTRELFGTVARLAPGGAVGAEAALPALTTLAAGTAQGLDVSAVPSRRRGGTWWTVVGLLTVLLPAVSLVREEIADPSRGDERARYVQARDLVGADPRQTAMHSMPDAVGHQETTGTTAQSPAAKESRPFQMRDRSGQPDEPQFAAGTGSLGEARGTGAGAASATTPDERSAIAHAEPAPRGSQDAFPDVDPTRGSTSGLPAEANGEPKDLSGEAGRVAGDTGEREYLPSDATSTAGLPEAPVKPLGPASLREVPGRYRDLVRAYFSGRTD